MRGGRPGPGGQGLPAQRPPAAVQQPPSSTIWANLGVAEAE